MPAMVVMVSGPSGAATSREVSAEAKITLLVVENGFVLGRVLRVMYNASTFGCSNAMARSCSSSVFVGTKVEDSENWTLVSYPILEGNSATPVADPRRSSKVVSGANANVERMNSSR